MLKSFDCRFRKGRQGERSEVGTKKREKVVTDVVLRKRRAELQAKSKILSVRTVQGELKVLQLEQERGGLKISFLSRSSGIELVPEQGFFG